MKNFSVALLISLCTGLTPFTVAADEAKPSNATAANATTPTALLEKTVGKWSGPFTRPASNFYFNYNMDFAVRKEGEKFMATLKSPNVTKEPVAELTVVDGKIVGDFSYDNTVLILTLQFKDDGSMTAELSVGRKGTPPPYDIRTGEFMRKE